MLQEANLKLAREDSQLAFENNSRALSGTQVFAVPLYSPQQLHEFIDEISKTTSGLQREYEGIKEAGKQLKDSCRKLEQEHLPEVRKNQLIIFTKLSKVLLRFAALKRQEAYGGDDSFADAARKISQVVKDLYPIFLGSQGGAEQSRTGLNTETLSMTFKLQECLEMLTSYAA